MRIAKKNKAQVYQHNGLTSRCEWFNCNVCMILNICNYNCNNTSKTHIGIKIAHALNLLQCTVIFKYKGVTKHYTVKSYVKGSTHAGKCSVILLQIVNDSSIENVQQICPNKFNFIHYIAMYLYIQHKEGLMNGNLFYIFVDANTNYNIDTNAWHFHQHLPIYQHYDVYISNNTLWMCNQL